MRQSLTRKTSGRTRRLRLDSLEPRLAPAAAAVIDYSTGFTSAEMIGGWSAGYAEGQLLLTNGPNEGMVAWNRARVDVRAFRTWFVFQQTDPEGAATPSRGDGFTFAMSSRQRSWAGTAGGGLGYQGITDSVAIKFDLVNNAGEGSNSVGLFTGGAVPTVPAVSLDGSRIDLHSGRAYRADVAYDGAGLTLTLTDVADPSLTWSHTFPVDIPAALGSSTGYVGFTAGTGQLAARQAIHAWEYTVEEPAAGVNRPPSISSAARAIPDSPTTVVLGGGASDDGGADGLTYTWTVVSTPAGAAPVVTPIDSPDYPAAARVTLDRVGGYTFLLTARDAGGEIATSAVGYVVAPAVTSLEVGPQAATVRSGGAAQFTAIPLDQFGGMMTLPGPVAWQVVSGPGAIDANGRYTAPADATGTATVRAVVPTSPPHITGEASVTVVPATPPAGGGLDFGAGFEGAALARNGSANVSGDRLRLADGRHQAGSAFAPDPVDVRGFTTSFRFRVGNGPGAYGDGFTFVLQNAGPAALGRAGGGLGYEGITQSVAVKFDLVDNAGEGTDSTGVYTGGAAPTVPADTFFTVYPLDSGIHLNNGDRYQVTLRYSGGTLLVNLIDLDRHARQFTKAYAVDIPAAVGGATAYVGFTAGTGELFAPIDILDWTYTPTVDANGDADPIIVQPPRATEHFVRARSTQLSALGADNGGEANLSYTWRVAFTPQGAGPVRFSENGTNAARTTTATFDQAGRYGFELLVTDAAGNDAELAKFSLEVVPTASAFAIAPEAPVVLNGATLAVAVEGLDQFGDPMPFGGGSGRVTVEGPGGISAGSGEYWAPEAGAGPVTLRVSNGAATGVARFLVVDEPSAVGVHFGRGFELSPLVAANGSAVRTYPWVRLTGSAADTAGSVFTTAPQDVTGFVTRFEFRPGEPDDQPDQGAGMAFVLQGVSPKALGASGAGLGYQGIERSVAIAFDSVANTIGLAQGGEAPVGTVPLAGTGIKLTRGHDLQADVYYDGRTLHVALTDLGSGAAATAAFEVDIPAAVGGDRAYVGFTASTGATVHRFASQTVASWDYRPVTPGSPNLDPLVVRPARMIAPVLYGLPTLPFSVRLVARAEDDGGPFDLRYRWEVVSAPAGANPTVHPLGTHGARLDQPGTYVFRVTITDARGASVTDEATYVLDPANWLRG